MWYNISASNGDEVGGKNRDIIAKQMTPSQIEKAQDLARECVAKNYKGCWVGRFYLRGRSSFLILTGLR